MTSTGACILRNSINEIARSYRGLVIVAKGTIGRSQRKRVIERESNYCRDSEAAVTSCGMACNGARYSNLINERSNETHRIY